MNEEFFAHLFPYVIIGLLVIGVFFVIIKGTGSSNATTIYGATAELYNTDKKPPWKLL
jgi:hypothetical protein